MKTNKNVYSLFIIITSFIFYFIEYIVNLVAEKKVLKGIYALTVDFQSDGSHGWPGCCLVKRLTVLLA